MDDVFVRYAPLNNASLPHSSVLHGSRSMVDSCLVWYAPLNRASHSSHYLLNFRYMLIDVML